MIRSLLIANRAQKTLPLAERVAAQRRGEARSNKQAPDRLNAPHPLTPSPQGRGMARAC